MTSRRTSGRKPRAAPREEGRELLEAALDEVADLVAICNAEGRLVFLNPAAHDGRLSAAQNPGGGAVFSFVLPTPDRQRRA